MALEYMTKAGYEALKKELADSLAQRPVISAGLRKPGRRETSPKTLNTTPRAMRRVCWR